MTAALATFLVAAAGVAGADQAVPDPHAGRSAKPSWSGQCAARLERARDEFAQKEPLFKGASVEVVANEVSVPGDPTARSTTDAVRLTLSTFSGPQYVVSVAYTDYLQGSHAWKDDNRSPDPPSLPPMHPSQLAWSRLYHGLLGTLYADQAPGKTLPLFTTTFKRAIDDCLRLGATAPCPNPRGLCP
ncbi:MAG: hypothetical protein EXR72_08465 [Myxococcales bacterium]|nr:hypothetical protein [Myxococcales bacterium]